MRDCDRCHGPYPSHLMRFVLLPDMNDSEVVLCVLCHSQLGLWLRQSPQDYQIFVKRRRRAPTTTSSGEPIH
jgi:hypothetical protein